MLALKPNQLVPTSLGLKPQTPRVATTFDACEKLTHTHTHTHRASQGKDPADRGGGGPLENSGMITATAQAACLDAAVLSGDDKIESSLGMYV